MLTRGPKAWRDEAEGELLDLVRRNGMQNFTMTISCSAQGWRIVMVDLDAKRTEPGSDIVIGAGSTFADAWHGQSPMMGSNTGR